MTKGNRFLQKPTSQQTIQTVTATRTEIHSGLLPHPEILSKYNEIIPNGANRIMEMAEKQQEHRIELEKMAIRLQLRQSARGQIYGFIISLFGLMISLVCILLGHELAGSILGGTGLLGLVSVFVLGKAKQRKSIEEKKSD